MKARPCKKLINQRRTIALTLTMLAWLTVIPLTAEETAQKTKQDPIRITADELLTDNANRTAVFEGNVKAVQGNTVITAEQLTIIYRSQSGPNPSAGAANIERLEALGKVRIEFDNKVAVTHQAVYSIDERKLVMTGPESKIISGQDEISGTKITFFRDSGKMALEGDDNNRVKAIIHSDQRGLN